MSLESGMNRRKFIKTAASGGLAGAGILEQRTQAQERKPLDNHIRKFQDEADNIKINFPDKFKPITPEVESLIATVRKYQNAFLGEVALTNSAVNNSNVPESTRGINAPKQEDITKVKLELWEKIKTIEPSLGAFSEEDFYHFLMMDMPKFLSGYGIYVRPTLITITGDDHDGKPPYFVTTEFLGSFLNIEKVEQEELVRNSQRLKVDLIYTRGKFDKGSEPMNEISPPAENAYRNIMVSLDILEMDHKNVSANFDQLRREIGSGGKDGALKTNQAELERTNSWDTAANIAIIRLISRMPSNPTFEEYRLQFLNHEAQHLLDREEGTLQRTFPPTNISDPTLDAKLSFNYHVHDEINLHIAEVRYAPNRVTALLMLINTSKSTFDKIFEKRPVEWVLQKMIDLILQDSGKYKIKIDETSTVARKHQILSQLDTLMDQPTLYDDLLEQVLQLHKKNYSEDLTGGYVPEPNQIPKTDVFKTIIEIGLPLTALGVGLEALRRRKNKIRENMPRQQRREEERKQRKKVKK